MEAIGASKLSLSSITSEELWRRSGRLDKVSPELFRLLDRKQVPIMLSPTHEEEITALVASTLKSYKDLPLRLYQTTRKYRDEMRPRQGLLRSREFVMKDLYTFDASVDSAISTYRDVSGAYRAFFADLKIPILVAEASSGDMGGDHSHEYHLANPVGEDNVITCNSCSYTANDEVATSREACRTHQDPLGSGIGLDGVRVWRGISKDRKTLINAWYPGRNGAGLETEVNMHAVKKAVPELDTSVSDAERSWGETMSSLQHTGLHEAQIINVVDMRLMPVFQEVEEDLPVLPMAKGTPRPKMQTTTVASHTGQGLNLLRPVEGDGCPRCESGQLRVHRALELGHTFYLGARYSGPLKLSMTLPHAKDPALVEMGCFGIGVSRIFAAVAEHKADERGLNWPRAIAPFEIVVIPTSRVTEQTLEFHDELTRPCGSRRGFDAILDDRKETFGWKVQDADMIGYPVVIVLGRAWREEGVCEVQCRSLSLKDDVAADDLAAHLDKVLSQL